MKSKIFLLITDDPDDCVAFSSALDDVSEDVLVLTVADGRKASKLLEETILVPHCVLINLLMLDSHADQILLVLKNGTVYDSTVRITYGGEGEEFDELDNGKNVDFFKGSLLCAELRERFTRILQASD